MNWMGRAGLSLMVCLTPAASWAQDIVKPISRDVRFVDGRPENQQSPITAIAWSDKGGVAATADEKNNIWVWDVKSGARIAEFTGHRDRITSIRIGSNEKFMVSASMDKTVRVWDLRTLKPMREMRLHDSFVFDAALSRKGGTLFSIGADEAVMVTPLKTGTAISNCKLLKTVPRRIALTGDNKIVVIGDWKGKISLHDSKALCTVVREYNDLKSNVIALDVRENTVSAVDARGNIVVIDAGKAGPTRKTEGQEPATAAAVDAAKGIAVLVAAGGNLVFRKLGDGSIIKKAPAPKGDPYVSVLINGAQDRVLAGHKSGALTILNLNGEYDDRLRQGFRLELAVNSEDGEYTASSHADGTIRVWNPATGVLKYVLSGHAKPVRGMAFGRGGVMASASEDGTVRIWDLKVGRELKAIAAKANLTSVGMSPDAKLVMAGVDDGRILAWEVASGDQVWSAKAAKTAVVSLHVHPAGAFLVALAQEGPPSSWQAANGKVFSPMDADPKVGPITLGAFSDDGMTFAGAGKGGTLVTWKLDTKKGFQPGKPLQGHSGEVVSIARIPGKNVIMSLGRDNVVRLWSMKDLTGVKAYAVQGMNLAGLGYGRADNNAVVFDRSGMMRVWALPAAF
ncbi:MAG: hypothetical protein GMKNLPBB_01934 [Myxococcota bacterium]|nr:hypothetical protein [Myxococcota bacterium]